MSGHYVCHLKKEGRWVELGERDVQAWANVFFEICICSEQVVYSWLVSFLCRHISPKIVSDFAADCRCDESTSVTVEIYVEMYHWLSCPYFRSLCSFGGISSVPDFIYLNFSQLPLPSYWLKPIRLWADTSVGIASTAVLILALVFLGSHFLIS